MIFFIFLLLHVDIIGKKFLISEYLNWNLFIFMIEKRLLGLFVLVVQISFSLCWEIFNKLVK
jgi:hypothetical protein